MSTGRTFPTGVGAPILLEHIKITRRVRPLQRHPHVSSIARCLRRAALREPPWPRATADERATVLQALADGAPRSAVLAYYMASDTFRFAHVFETADPAALDGIFWFPNLSS